MHTQAVLDTIEALPLPPLPLDDTTDRTTDVEIMAKVESFIDVLSGAKMQSRSFRSRQNRDNFRSDLVALDSIFQGSNLDFSRLRAFWRIITSNPSKLEFWNEVFEFVDFFLIGGPTLSQQPPIPQQALIPQQPQISQEVTPRKITSGHTSSETREKVNDALAIELGVIPNNSLNFLEHHFEPVRELANRLFDRLQANNLYTDPRWTTWPPFPAELHVVRFLNGFHNTLCGYASTEPLINADRQLFSNSRKHVKGSNSTRCVDIALANPGGVDQDGYLHWQEVLIPGELKSNVNTDTKDARMALAVYVREVFGAQPDRFFVVGFTLCNDILRLIHFDRLGAVASAKININTQPREFVMAWLSFLCMDKKRAGYDPTIMKNHQNQRYIEIDRQGNRETIILKREVQRLKAIVGRCTTAWEGYRLGDSPSNSLFIKDSWQHFQRMPEEGELLNDAEKCGVRHVARCYHYETVMIDGNRNTILNYVRAWAREPQVDTAVYELAGAERPGPSSLKRLVSQSSVVESASKKYPSVNPRGHQNKGDRVHRRVVLSDFGECIYMAHTPLDLLWAFEDCLRGYKDLHLKAKIIHRDISIWNLMIRYHGNDSSANQGRKCSGFITDLDLAIREDRVEPSGAKSITGTRAFMAIGLLNSEPHTFVHDLESFFWVLVWISIHYAACGKGAPFNEDLENNDYNLWHTMFPGTLARAKRGMVHPRSSLIRDLTKHISPHYLNLMPVLVNLRDIVIPGEDPFPRYYYTLYDSMLRVLEDGIILLGREAAARQTLLEASAKLESIDEFLTHTQPLKNLDKLKVAQEKSISSRKDGEVSESTIRRRRETDSQFAGRYRDIIEQEVVAKNRLELTEEYRAMENAQTNWQEERIALFRWARMDPPIVE